MEKYIDLLKKWTGEYEDLCYEMYQMLMKENECNRIQCFQLLCETFKTVTSDESLEIDTYFDDGEIQQLEELYGNSVDEMIISIRKKADSKKLGKKEFYQRLWDTVINGSLLETEKEKAFGLLWIFADDGIPYFELDVALTMDNEEYKKIIDDNKELFEKIKYILLLPFEQKTEVASLILQEILELDDYKTQTVLLSQVMSISHYNEMSRMRKFLEMTKRMSEEV